MKNKFFGFDWTTVTALVIACLTLASCCYAQPQYRLSAVQESSVKNFIQRYVGLPPNEMDKEARYSDISVDLKGDGSREVIVYLVASSWCGTGGCTTLILAPEGDSYKVVANIAATRLPIRVLVTKSNGWFDISVVARINGIKPLYEAILSFDGKTYPSNPSIPPARRLLRKVPGKVVISNATENKPLF